MITFYKAFKMGFLVYIGILLILYFLQEKIIFYPQKVSKYVLEKYRPHEYSFVSNGVELHGWFVKKLNYNHKPLIIYYGGNAEEVGLSFSEMNKMDAGSYLFMNYRGYGKSRGVPSEKSLFKDALRIFDHVVQKENIPSHNIVLMGRSLGSGVATYVASQRKVSGVILITPFDSLLKIAQKHYPIFPVRWLLRHRFDSFSLAQQINVPLLALIAAEDEIIPRENSMALIKRWSGKATYQIIDHAGHNDISLYETYWNWINQFIGEVGT